MRLSPLTFMHVKQILVKYTFGKLPLKTTAIWNHKCNPKCKQRTVHYMIKSIESIDNSTLFNV